MKKIGKVIVAILSILIGLYPFVYFLVDEKFGLLNSKSNDLLTNTVWNTAFYTHITLGGIALLVGWTQFSKRIRSTRLKLHKLLGKVYVITVLISGVSGVYIGLFATGGIIASLGFIGLGMTWLYSTIAAYRQIVKGQINKHQILMHYSYAACFAAVTLRIWLPVLTVSFGDFIIAYSIVAWLCWIPNLIVAYYLTRNIRSSTRYL
ncbi:DUF2306 domain-containing protein [Aquimarina sp. 2201CG14-23]|uniref:DUF2306 domain-containing protein n=1 Tax=Aquimarina mycalae TaxID=3040073 RepID=UPI002478148A|nr:DUF2306 domain-containing protein [Aquimarina sp. 2201CG14-23]MDH7446979.1 DUF2306 domain-containing protein [Aquimarina sp. 2201CG14-23]